MRDDPFAKLGGALDQKLFQTPTDQPTSSPPTRETVDSAPPQPTKPKPSSQKTREVGKEGSREVGKEVGRDSSFLFDLTVTPYRKDSYLFTDHEFEALEDLKLELRRSFDLKATKQDIARCAMGYLLEDYHRNGEASFIVRHLKTKK